jgi:hypothetical protein
VKSRGPRHKILLAVLLLLPSAAAYVLHWAIFRNAHDIFFYLLMDVAFLFVQAVMATLVFDQLLNARERQANRRKLNVAVGVFFSQVGNPLLRVLSAFDGRGEDLCKHLRIDGAWTEAHFAKMQTVLRGHEPAIEAGRGDLALLKITLERQRDFLLRLLENPNLLEHETLTEMLWSVFHLADELSHRSSVLSLPSADRIHLENDIKRAYDWLVREWLRHMQHLRATYPYLFSLAVRTNPFDPEARVEVS